MWLLLGLFFFSILLTTGSSLKCSYCLVINGYCSGTKTECPPESDVCMSLALKPEDEKISMQAKFENCSMTNICKPFEDLIGKTLPGGIIPGVPGGVIVEYVACSKAPPSFASFFPAFLGCFLMKLLF